MRRRSATGLGLLVLSVVLIGLTLRAPIVSLPPLLPTISADFGYSAAITGLVTSLPLIAFAVLSPIVPLVVRALGVDATVLLFLLLLGGAILVRPWVGGPGLLIGTLLIGVAITVGNVVIPVLVRRDAGRHVPRVMAASTSAYGVGQALTSFVAVPAAAVVGWRWSISLPALLVALATLAWIVRMRSVPATTPGSAEPAESAPASPPSAPADPAVAARTSWTHVWRQGGAWWLALFFGMQSLMFYTASTWVPTQLVETGGLSAATAGAALSVFHVIGVPGTLLMPPLLRRVGDARLVGAGVGVGWIAFFVGLGLLPGLWTVWMVVGGIVQGAGIGLGLTLIASRPVDADYGRHLSGMVQGAGYALAALGPVVVGRLHEAAGGWSASTVLLIGCAATMTLAARRAGAPEPIGSRAG